MTYSENANHFGNYEGGEDYGGGKDCGGGRIMKEERIMEGERIYSENANHFENYEGRKEQTCFGKKDPSKTLFSDDRKVNEC